MKSRVREKFVPACYRPMILDEWQHLRQEEGTVADYIARFHDLMIRCNVDEEPMATLARFRARLRPEFHRELLLHEVSTLERAYRYALNMEMYTMHNLGGRTDVSFSCVVKIQKRGSNKIYKTELTKIRYKKSSIV